MVCIAGGDCLFGCTLAGPTFFAKGFNFPAAVTQVVPKERNEVEGSFVGRPVDETWRGGVDKT